MRGLLPDQDRFVEAECFLEGFRDGLGGGDAVVMQDDHLAAPGSETFDLDQVDPTPGLTILTVDVVGLACPAGDHEHEPVIFAGVVEEPIEPEALGGFFHSDHDVR